MLRNYLKITLAVMRRRKVFTLISLFGISMTLSILIVLTAFYEHVFSTSYPEPNRDRCLYTTVIEQVNTKESGMMRGPLSVYFIQKYVATLPLAEKVGYSSMTNTINTYGNGRKISLYYKYTDPIFWEITGFDFLEGRPYTQKEFDNNEAVAVINDQTRDDYFGKGVAAVGKFVEINGQNLRVIGVVRGCPITRMMVAADIYMPYHLQKKDEDGLIQRLDGEYMAMVLTKNKEDMPKIQQAYAELLPKIPLATVNGFTPDKINSNMSSYFESIVRDIFFSQSSGSIHIQFYTIVTLFALLFMSLPAINLININISRILERSSEIGIRKAFGASSRALVTQFVTENILLTLIGGLLAILISAAFLWWFNASSFLDYADLHINWTVASAAFLLSLVFGLMSGVYPAWRMSRLPAVEALRG